MEEPNDESFEWIKPTFDIVETIGKYFPLSKKGVNYVARCPFHKDVFRSFIVNSKHQIYKCFTCGAAGDSVKFVMDLEGLSYGRALLQLAEKNDGWNRTIQSMPETGTNLEILVTTDSGHIYPQNHTYFTCNFQWFRKYVTHWRRRRDDRNL